jgi:FkbH-like protein
MKYTEILAANKEFSKINNAPKYNIGILSNIIINSFKDILEYQCFKNNINPSVEIGNYDNIVQDSLIYSNKDLIIIFYDTLNIFEGVDEFFENASQDLFISLLTKCKNELDIVFKNLEKTPSVIINSFSYSTHNSSSIRVSKLEDFVNELNSYLNKNAPINFCIIDINKIFSMFGLSELVDFRFFNSSKAPYTINFFKQYSEEIEHILLKNNGKLKKAIIFDCDNTLWKGVLGEDGIDGIEMGVTSHSGKYFNMIQKIIVYLSQQGIIVGLCSKNNEKDILELFELHEDIFLKSKHIVIHKINWSDKATNLKEISAELNIGLDSIVFVDDSSFEINLIREQLPEVTTIQVPTSLYLYPSVLLKNIYKYFNLNVTKDDLKKTDMYKEQLLRSQEKEKHTSIEQYLSSLEIEITIEKDQINQIERLSQLTQKTNQFNLTTKRYTENQIKNFILSKEFHVYSLSVRDKFGENGITGLCIIHENKIDDESILNIDTFLMSCRVIGRNIEFQFFNVIMKQFLNFKIKKIEALFIKSNKNEQVNDFYEKLNFDLINSVENEKFYLATFESLRIDEVPYVKVTHIIK